MKSKIAMTALLSAWLCLAGAAWAQQNAPAGGVPAHIVVTVEPKHGANVPTINREDVKVSEGREHDAVTDWIPLQGDRAGLQLFVLIDDSLSSSLGSQLEDIRAFINNQLPTTKIGVAYMQEGTAKVIQELTNDHALAAKALRLPMGNGGGEASPYFSLTDLVKRWPEGQERREVLMVTDGVDRYYGIGDPQDPYLMAAIDDAIRAGILVSAIYSPGVGHFGHSYWQSYWGQIYLSQLADETGGEAYYIGFSGAPVSFSPYLEDLSRRLQHQYLLGFQAKPQKKSGFQKVRITTEIQNVDLVSAGRVYVNVEH